MLLKCINPEFLYAEKNAVVSCCVSGFPKNEKYKALILKYMACVFHNKAYVFCGVQIRLHG